VKEEDSYLTNYLGTAAAQEQSIAFLEGPITSSPGSHSNNFKKLAWALSVCSSPLIFAVGKQFQGYFYVL